MVTHRCHPSFHQSCNYSSIIKEKRHCFSIFNMHFHFLIKFATKLSLILALSVVNSFFNLTWNVALNLGLILISLLIFIWVSISFFKSNFKIFNFNIYFDLT